MRWSRCVERMTTQRLLTTFQRLLLDAEPLAFKPGCEDTANARSKPPSTTLAGSQTQ
jgi:hypothetical protein